MNATAPQQNSIGIAIKLRSLLNNNELVKSKPLGRFQTNLNAASKNTFLLMAKDNLRPIPKPSPIKQC